MTYFIQPMRREDMAQVVEIDREAFPTIWPPTNYARELQNPLARCIVAYDDQRVAQEIEKAVPKSGLSLHIARILGLFRRHHTDAGLSGSDQRYIVGFASLWILADEAHLTNIAVRESRQRQGIGELLLLSSIDLAAEAKTRVVTLEVRASNNTAQALYQKYGFNQVGLRRGYYMDNKEDAILMSTDDIHSASYRSQLQNLKQAHLKKLGIAQ